MTRNERISIRVTQAEKAAIEKLAFDARRKISDYVRHILLNEVEKAEQGGK